MRTIAIALSTERGRATDFPECQDSSHNLSSSAACSLRFRSTTGYCFERFKIQFLLGHGSVQTTERYDGCKQNLGHPVTIFLTSERARSSGRNMTNVFRRTGPAKL